MILLILMQMVMIYLCKHVCINVKLFFILTENQKLQEELTKLRKQNSQLEKKIEAESSYSEIKRLQEEIGVLVAINNVLGNESDELRKKLSGYEKFNLPSLSQDTNFGSSTGEESSKRNKMASNFGSSSEEESSKRDKSKKSKFSKKSKGKRKIHSASKKAKEKRTYDEESSPGSDSSNTNGNPDDEKMARVCVIWFNFCFFSVYVIIFQFLKHSPNRSK
jgi:hypothetical protein